MASRRARQRLKGGGGGDTGPAAEKLRELLGSREAGSAEQRPECVCGRRAWRAGGRAAGGLRSEPGSPGRLLLPLLGVSGFGLILARPQIPALLELGSATLQVQAHTEQASCW